MSLKRKSHTTPLSSTNGRTVGVSIVIPTHNEEMHIGRCLESLSLVASAENDASLEVILADGASVDGTESVAREFPCVQVIQAPKGRAAQMNFGASHAKHSVLWFLHADSVVPAGALEALREQMLDDEILGGAFGFRLDAKGWPYRLIEWGVRVRTNFFGTPYGDQGIFLRRDTFEDIGGYPVQPILEDLELWRRLHRAGSTRMLQHEICTSARRWTERGVLKTTVLNWLVVVMSWCGCSPERLRAVRDF